MFSWNIAKFLRAGFFIEHLRWLLLGKNFFLSEGKDFNARMLHILKSAKEYFPTISSGILIVSHVLYLFCGLLCYACLPRSHSDWFCSFQICPLLHYFLVKIFLQCNKKYVIWNKKLNCKSVFFSSLSQVSCWANIRGPFLLTQSSLWKVRTSCTYLIPKLAH